MVLWLQGCSHTLSWGNKPQKQKWEREKETVPKGWHLPLQVPLVSSHLPLPRPNNSPCSAFAVSVEFLWLTFPEHVQRGGDHGVGVRTVLSVALGLTHSTPQEPSGEETGHAGQLLASTNPTAGQSLDPNPDL